MSVDSAIIKDLGCNRVLARDNGRFSFKGDLPALELALRRCLQRWGICRLLYYDNGATYRARHMKHIVAELGMHPIIYTTTYRPMGQLTA